MKNHFPLWLVVATGTVRSSKFDATTAPVIFSSTEKMAAWLGSRKGENRWHVQLMNRQAATEVLNDLSSRGYTEVYADLNGQPAGTMQIADLVLNLESN